VTARQANSTLADLPQETEYRSDSHDLVRDFYLLCLSRSTLYRRAVGYFTSRGLSLAAAGSMTTPLRPRSHRHDGSRSGRCLQFR
jgi:hypothetical protein